MPPQGEDELDEEDMIDLMLEQQARVARAASEALPRGGALTAIRTAQMAAGPDIGSGGSGGNGSQVGLGAWVHRVSGQQPGDVGSRRSPHPPLLDVDGGPVAEGIVYDGPQGVAGVALPVRKLASAAAAGGSLQEILQSAEAEVRRVIHCPGRESRSQITISAHAAALVGRFKIV